MPNDTEKILTIINGTLTHQSKQQDKLLGAISELIQTIKGQKMVVEAPVVNITSPEVKIPDITIPDIKLPNIEIPKAEIEVKIPPIEVPRPQVTVNVEKPDTPIVNVPAPIVNIDIPKEMEVTGMREMLQQVIDAVLSPTPIDYHRGNPMPVQLIDLDGNPYKARGGGTMGISSGGSDAPAGNPVGYEQQTVTSTAEYLSSIPSGAIRAVVTVEGDTIRWRDDGTAPTSSIGVPMVQGQSFELPTSSSISQFQVIKDASATSTPLLNISFYKR